MKTSRIAFIFLASVLTGACHSSKKTTAATVAGEPAPVSTNTGITAPSDNNFVLLRPAGGIYAPGNEELTAIQLKSPAVTLEQLKKGHIIYTQGACVRCHGAESIYKYSEGKWEDIIRDMSFKAQLNEADEQAVRSYVLSIKATQPK